MEENLIDFAYEFYPKEVHGLDENYNKTTEIIKLRHYCKSIIEGKYEGWLQILNKIRKVCDDKTSVIDTTSFFIGKPSFACQIIQCSNDRKVIVEIYQSFLISYFYISESTYCENILINYKINTFTNFPTVISETVKLIKHEHKSILFPSELLCKVVPNVSFDTIGYGDFVLQHAFFNKEKL